MLFITFVKVLLYLFGFFNNINIFNTFYREENYSV